MPNRMIRDWTDSLRMDGISAEAERLFTRLIMRADDYGRFHADHRLVKASCFPLADDIRVAEVGPWLNELADRGLVVLYEVDGRKTLAIANYGQRLRTSRAKFPPLPGECAEWLPEFSGFQPVAARSLRSADNCPRLPATSGNPPPEEKPKGSGREVETEAEVETEQEAESGQAAPPSEVLPLGWKKLTKAEQGRKKVNHNTPDMIRIGKFFGQRETTLWTIAEHVALQDVNPPDDEIELIEDHFSLQLENNGYRHTAIITLLNNWTAARNRAVAYFLENPDHRNA